MKRIIYDVPKWHVLMHRTSRGLPLAETSDDARVRFEDELFERLYSGEPDLLPEKQRSAELREWAEKIHGVCDQLPEFQRLTSYCRGDADVAGMAVEELMDLLEPHLQKPPDEASAPLLRRAINAGCSKAVAAIDAQSEAVDALEQVGFSSKLGNATGSRNPISSRALAKRLKDDPRLRDIAKLAGRFKRIAANKQRSKVKHGADEIADVEMGADIGRLLPSELCRLNQPAQRLSFLRDLTERQCMQYRLSGKEPLGKGPLVLLLDKSGSMDGAKDVWGTAIALALLDIAQKQRRIFHLICFESVLRYEATVLPGDPLPEEGLFVKPSGGTEIGDAMKRALDLIETTPAQLKKADVVLITDGWSEPSSAPALRALAKELGVTVLGFGIGVGEEIIQPWCDQLRVVQKLEMDDAAATMLFGL